MDFRKYNVISDYFEILRNQLYLRKSIIWRNYSFQRRGALDIDLKLKIKQKVFTKFQNSQKSDYLSRSLQGQGQV